jgi:ceramide glucosyltransferase
MDLILAVAAALCLFLIGAQLFSTALVGFRLGAARGRRPSPAAFPVTILRPVCGLDYLVEETLGSTFRLSRRPLEIIFCAASEDDPVVPLLRRLIAAHPNADAKLLIGDEHVAANAKLNNVAKGWRAASHDLIVMADSNVVLSDEYLDRLLECWGPDVGLVSLPAVGTNPDGFWAELECAFLDTFEARWLFAADSLGMGFAQGKTLLLRRSDIDLAGGYDVLGREIAEDSAATKAIRRLGKKVRLASYNLSHPLGPRRLQDVWGRQVRWAQLRRASFPLAYAAEILAGALPAVLLTLFLVVAGAVHPVWLLALLIGWYCAEALLALTAGWRLILPSPLFWMLRDLLIPAVWVAGWVRSRYSWRGRDIDLKSGTFRTPEEGPSGATVSHSARE